MADSGFAADTAVTPLGAGRWSASVRDGWDIAGNHLEQARFSGPVAADQADALPRFNPQAGVVEQGEEAERKRDAVQSE